MENGFTVEAIVAQIRSRIAEEKSRRPSPSPARSLVSEVPAWDASGCRQRMEDDASRFAELDLHLEEVTRSIGQQPLAPPTWRGRLGGWMVQALRRLLWWYGLPVKDAVTQIGLRNREQAIRHRHLHEDLLELSECLRSVVSRIDGLERTQKIDEALRSLGERMTDAMGRAERIEHFANSLNKKLQTEAQAREVLASAVIGQTDKLQQITRCLESLEDTFKGHLELVSDRQQEGLLVLSESLRQAVSRIDEVERTRQSDEVLGRLGERIGDAIVGAELGLQQITSALNTQLQAEARAREGLADVVGGLAGKLRFDEELRHVAAGIADVHGRAERLEHLVNTLNMQLQAEARTREILAEVVNDQLGKLREVAGRPKPFANLPTNDSISALYAKFEDTFRGRREQIKERQQVYLPCLIEAHVGSSSDPVLDLGCGRGEWIELLTEHHLVAGGVDCNPGMIERCRVRGIDVIQGDALSHLRGLADGSVGAITSFHMVEHMPFEALIALLDEALRVLRTGGVLILESPNSQNILVGANTFWIDPTHIKPIPSQTLRFFVEARGFRDAEVWNLQPNTEAVRLPEDPAGIGARLNEYLFGPQDYGIIARRP